MTATTFPITSTSIRCTARIEDFQAFLSAAHDRDLQVMIELVVNHTSDQHPWFQAARQAPPGSPERDFYVWSDTDQKYKDARIIFTDTERSNWTWDPVAKQYYWHRFFSHQPDLNYDNPRVVEEVLKVMRFWLDMGVDALRVDAIPYLVERDGTSCENLPETHAVVKTLRREIDADYSNRMLLAEANQWPTDVRPYFGDGDECHMAFHFPLMPRIYMALRQEDRLPITDIIAQTPAIPDTCQWGLFLRNHDELTLEMVTNDERDYMYLAYSADPRMRINLGIRRRLAPLVDNNRRRIELLNSLLFSFPGTPIIYYGDEIGMGDNIYLGDRNGVRTPMQWNADRNAGFSTATPARLYSPVIMDPVWGYEAINVEAQQGESVFASELDAQHDRPAKTLSRVRARAQSNFSILRTAKCWPISGNMRENRFCASRIFLVSRSPSIWISRNSRARFPSKCSATWSFQPLDASPIVLLWLLTVFFGWNFSAGRKRKKPPLPPMKFLLKSPSGGEAFSKVRGFFALRPKVFSNTCRNNGGSPANQGS